MIKRSVLLAVVMILSLSMGACQKAKELEVKKSGTAQKTEVKQPPVSEGQPQMLEQGQSGETIPTAGLPVQGQSETQAIPAEHFKENVQTAESQGTINFKEPVLLWEREFDPPIREISDQNGNGDFLAVQVKTEEGSGNILSQKLLVIDSKGNTKREEVLAKKKNLTIPAEQLWLTASSDEELQQLKKAKRSKEIQAWGREIFISSNGEYYATVMQYGGWYEFEYKDKNGKTLWKITPKDNYGFEKAYISYDGSRIVIIDMGGLGGGDDWEILGQRVSFYDNTGRLLRDYDYGEKTDDWLNPENINISKNSQYISGLRGYQTSVPIHDEYSVVLFGADGQILYSKTLLERHNISVPTNSGETLVYWDYLSATYMLNNDGIVIWKEEPPKKIGSSHLFSDRFIYYIKERYDAQKRPEQISIYSFPDNKLIYSGKINDLWGEFKVRYSTIGDILENNGVYFQICGYSDDRHSQQCILLDLKKQKILYKGERYLGRFANEGRLTITAIRGKNKNIAVYSLEGGK